MRNLCDLGDNTKVDRKASTPSSSSSDVSKSQTFLDKKIKTYLAVITPKAIIALKSYTFHSSILSSIQPVSYFCSAKWKISFLYSRFFMIFANVCWNVNGTECGDGVVQCTLIWQISFDQFDFCCRWIENNAVEARSSSIALIVKVFLSFLLQPLTPNFPMAACSLFHSRKLFPPLYSPPDRYLPRFCSIYGFPFYF